MALLGQTVTHFLSFLHYLMIGKHAGLRSQVRFFTHALSVVCTLNCNNISSVVIGQTTEICAFMQTCITSIL